MFIRGLGGLYGWRLQFSGETPPSEQPTERSQLGEALVEVQVDFPLQAGAKRPEQETEADQNRHFALGEPQLTVQAGAFEPQYAAVIPFVFQFVFLLQIGRHVLGSQVFDYWRDPWGHMFEHYADGDLLTASSKPGNYPALPENLAQWGPPVTPTFFS